MTEEQKIEILYEIDLFNQKGPWVPLAKKLAEAKDHGEDLTFTDLKNNANRLIAAYRFLEVRRPEALEDPDITGEYRAIACLPTLYGRLPAEEKESKIEALLDKVLNKEIPTYVVERYATTLSDESKKALDDYVIPAHMQKIEGTLISPSEEVLNAVKAYKQGSAHWINLAKALTAGKDREEDFTSIGVSYSQIKKLITAYGYLEVRRPDLLTEPDKVKASIDSLALLPYLSSKAPPEIVDECFEKVLSGAMSRTMLYEVLHKYEVGRPATIQRVKESAASSMEEMSVIDNRWLLMVFHFILMTLETMIQKYGYEALRKSHSKICDDLATQFRCIADPGYKKQWDERKVGQL